MTMKQIRKFRNDESGSATVEAVLWLPLFVVFFVMVADVSFVFHRQAQTLRIVQDANRALSVGRLTSEDETEDFIVAALSGLTTGPIVSTTIDAGVITTRTLLPVSDLTAVGMFDFISDYNILVTSQHFVEY
jgi:Flp pilus assembly protein TadG